MTNFDRKRADAGSTRALAYGFLDAIAQPRFSSSKIEYIAAPDCLVHLPRSTANFLASAGLDTPISRLPQIIDTAQERFDLQKTKVLNCVYDIFEGERGGIGIVLELETHTGQAIELQTTLTFERRGSTLCSVWVHADTAMVRRILKPASRSKW